MSAATDSQYGPSLRELLAPRWQALGPMSRAIVLAGILGVVIAALAYYESRRKDEIDLQYRGAAAPAFDTVHPAILERVPPERGELYRMELNLRGTLVQRMVIKPFRLRPRAGGVSGRLPLEAIPYARAARSRVAGFRLTFEGATRLRGATAYQIAFTGIYVSRTGVRRTLFGKTVLLPEETEHPRRGIAIEMLATTLSPVRAPLEVGNLGVLKKPFRSLEFAD